MSRIEALSRTGEGELSGVGNLLLSTASWDGWERLELGQSVSAGRKHRISHLHSSFMELSHPACIGFSCGVLFETLVLLMVQVSKKQGEKHNIYLGEGTVA